MQLAILDDVGEVLAGDAGEGDGLAAIVASVLSHILDQDAHLSDCGIDFEAFLLLTDEHKFFC